MPNFFTSIYTGLKAIQVSRTALDTVGHNIANANTEGFSRQRVIQTTSEPYTFPSPHMPGGAGQIGTGVKISEIERIRDHFIDGQIREERQSLGYWQKRFDGVHRIELTLNEPSESGLGQAMNDFWKALSDLGNNPEDPAARETVMQRGLTLTDAFHSIRDQLNDYKVSINDDVNSNVYEINSLARRIADLNVQIVSIKSSGQQPNDLMDKRDLLFEELNEKISVQGKVDQRGNLNITIGGVGLVNNSKINELDILKMKNTAEKDEDKVVFRNSGEEVLIDDGELLGLLNIRDDELDSYIDSLDQMAVALKDHFNEVHQTGFDLYGQAGLDFFSGDNAQNITVADTIINDVNKIASSATTDGVPGDSSNAFKLGDAIMVDKLFNNGKASIFEYYQYINSTLGIDGQRARQMVDNQQVLVEQLKNQRGSISGVSLDEEMANMIRFQHAYNAAAKVITTTDRLMETLLGVIR